MIRELDQVALTNDIPEHGLKVRDMDTVVLLHGSEGYEVEFVALDRETVSVVSLFTRDVRPAGHREIAHARAIGT